MQYTWDRVLSCSQYFYGYRLCMHVPKSLALFTAGTFDRDVLVKFSHECIITFGFAEIVALKIVASHLL